MMDGKKINGPRKRGGSSVLLRFAKTSIWERLFCKNQNKIYVNQEKSNLDVFWYRKYGS